MHLEPHASDTAPVLRAPRAATLAITALVCATLASGCGSSKSAASSPRANLDTTRVAASIEQTLLEKRHLHSTVVCPAAVPQEKGRTFECIATIRATKPPHAVSKAPFVVTIQTDRGYVTYVGK
jgi:hypothetical protein